MRKYFSMNIGGKSNSNGEGCEFAEEAKPVEGLKLQGKDLIRHALDSEFARVCRNPVDGMYVIPSASDPHCWFGLLFIRRGVFGGGIFRFTVNIASDFPHTREMPTVTFDLDIFHPNIDMKTRELDMSKYFPDGWKKDKHHILHVLLVTQRVFFSLVSECDQCINAEAAILWKEDRSKFRELAKECVNRSRAQVYDDPQQYDENAIRLTPWDPSQHEAVRKCMMLMNGGRAESVQWGERAEKQSGLSWIDADKMTYMTEPITARLDYDQEDSRAEQDRMAFGIEKLDLSGVVGEEESPENSAQVKREKDSFVSEFETSDDSMKHEKLKRTDEMGSEEKEEQPKNNAILHDEGGESDI